MVKTILDFAKAHKKLTTIVLVFVVLILILFLYTSPGQTNKTQTPSTTGTASWTGIIPGQTTKKDVDKILGNPLITNGDTSDYKSSSQTQNNRVTYENGKVVFIKHIITNADNPTTAQVTNDFGTSATRLYGPESSAGIYLFVYPDRGIAYLGNPQQKFLFEVWYFEPMGINDFIAKWAPLYSTSQTNTGF